MSNKRKSRRSAAEDVALRIWNDKPITPEELQRLESMHIILGVAIKRAKEKIKP